MLHLRRLISRCVITPIKHTQFKNTCSNTLKCIPPQLTTNNYSTYSSSIGVISLFPLKITHTHTPITQINRYYYTHSSSNNNHNISNPVKFAIISLFGFALSSNAICEETPSSTSPPSTTSPTSSSSSSSSSPVCSPSQYAFECGVCVIPHPEKADKGGEDSYFISDDRTALGVADGVGGWNKKGVDPALYARALMEGAKIAANKKEALLSPVKLMWAGYEAAKSIKGSSTCCIVLMADGNLLSANLGDSGFMILREDKIIFRTKEQQHSFNFPFQLGGVTSSSRDTPDHSDKNTILVKPNDVVILGTDGLWDNLYDNQILQIVKSSRSNPTQLATSIGQNASKIANDNNANSPFSDGASKAYNRIRYGGKLDDITVVVGVVKCGNVEQSTEETKAPVNVVRRLWAKL